jgi:hypothetical protein
MTARPKSAPQFVDDLIDASRERDRLQTNPDWKMGPKERAQWEERTRENYFAGRFENEGAACAELDKRLEQSGLFARIYKEVSGDYIATRPGREKKGCRIDRILVPGKELRARGWNHTIGVEAKRSGLAIGPAIAQSIDYTWAVFDCGPVKLYLDYIFLWPLHKQSGPIQSVMAQNRIGECRMNNYSVVYFYVGNRTVIRLEKEGRLTVENTAAGNKRGSR